MKKLPGNYDAGATHRTLQHSRPGPPAQARFVCRVCTALLLLFGPAACQGPSPTPRPTLAAPDMTPVPGVALLLPSPTAPGTPTYSVPVPLAPAPTPPTTVTPTTLMTAPRATPGANESARVTFQVDQGAISGLAWPQPDQPNLQSLRFLVSDGRTFLHDVTRDTDVRIEPPDATHSTWRITYTDREGRYRLVEEVSSAVGSDAVIVRAALQAQTGSALDYQVYLVAVPSLGGTAQGDSIAVNVSEAVALLSDRQPANGTPAFVAIATDTPWVTASAGYAGLSDGLSDLQDLRLDQAFESAGPGGNPALTVWLVPAGEWTIAAGVGSDADQARIAVVDALTEAYDAGQ